MGVMNSKPELEDAIQSVRDSISTSFNGLTTLTSPLEVIKAFKPKQILSWIMVGYRHWVKRQTKSSVVSSDAAKANKKLKNLNDAQLAILKSKLNKYKQ